MATEDKTPRNAKEALRKTRAKLEHVVAELTSAVEKANDHLEKKVEECQQGFTLMQQQRDLSISLASAADLFAGLQVSLDAGVQVSGMDCGGIYLFDNDSESLDLIVHRGLSGEFVQTICRYDRGSENARMVKAGDPVYILHKDLNVPLSPTEQIEGLRMFAMLPLVDGDHVIGCMNLGSHTQEDMPAAVRIAIETTAAQIGSALSRLKAREALEESEIELKQRTRNLEEANTALKVVIKNRENDRHDLEDKILSNLNSTIIPYLEKLKNRKRDREGKAWINIIESNLNEITSSFSKNLSSSHMGLTPTEIRVANLIKLGYTTKEIANQMNVSPKTTSIHRSTIRKKLGIARKKFNLRSYLLSYLDT